MATLDTATTDSLLSVIICTRDRASSLDQALRSITKMAVPPSLRWEIVVVDNGSTDNTPAVIESFSDRLPIRRVFESKPGLSNARNRGIASALGEYILWTDDDVDVNENWLAGYAKAFARFPDGVVFGGPIIPKLEEPTPVWFKENMDLLCDVMAVRDFGEAYLPLSTPAKIPYGANYAIRTAEQRKHPYDPELGVGPGMRRIGEETFVMATILEAGHTGYWVFDAKVFHNITLERQTERYVRRYFGGHGETSAFRLLSKEHRSKTSVIVHHGSRLLVKGAVFYGFGKLFSSTWRVRRIKGIGRHVGALNYAWKYRIRSDA